MNEQYVACPLCGTVFDSAALAGCQSCPLQSGCSTVCCPACGYQTIDAGSSALARLAGAVFSWFGMDSEEEGRTASRTA